MMNIDDRINYWVDIAAYDLKTADALIKSGRYLYVGFMCHQTIEKVLKAYYWYSLKKEPPYIHNLLVLSKDSKLYDLLSADQKDFLDFLEPLNIRARYPRDKDELLSYMTDKKCEEILQKTEEIFNWIKSLLRK
jgi:HEPN domain-containing protein